MVRPARLNDAIERGDPTIPPPTETPYRPGSRSPCPTRVPPTPTITRVEPLRPRNLEVRLHLDRGDPIEIMLETLERARLGVGDPLPSDRRHHLLNDDADIRVRHAALNLLSYRARSRTELGRRLRQKGFRPARVDLCLDRLEEKGFLDDGAVAEAFVRDRLRHRPRGRAALRSELRAKGIESGLAEHAIERVFDEADVDDPGLARSVAEGWVARQSADTLASLTEPGRSPERDRARRRLTGYLSRRGFRGNALRTGIAVAEEEARRAAHERR